MKWALQSLGNLFEQSGYNRAGSDDFPILSITMKQGLVDQTSKFKKRVASNDTSNYRVVYKNELVVGFPIDEGVLGFQTKYFAGIVSPAYGIWRIRDASTSYIPYLELYLRSPQARKVYASKMQGAVARRRSLTKEDFLKLEIPFPPLDDQIRIAHLLSKVEKPIIQRKQNLQQLDDLLKSVFLEMFGDPVRNERKWNSLPFHKIGPFKSGGTPSKSRDDYWSGNFPWISPKDMKVSKIEDAEDHISESVFQETTLKRIEPGHLLIVVRGMILAHSFPVAINAVEVAINQDMKAIKPIKAFNIIFLQHCLYSLKRQILKLISTASHGTRKFDSTAMEKLQIPIPSIKLQDQFAAIAEKVDSIKSHYQQSLTELETLYNALSQKAFKGELDLSLIPLPNTPIEPEQEPQTKVADLQALIDPALRQSTIAHWLEDYLKQIDETAAFSATQFIDVVNEKLLKHGDETPLFELDDYDNLKSLVFKKLSANTLTQSFEANSNSVALHLSSATQ